MEEKDLSLSQRAPLDKRVHVALPVRVTYWDDACKPHIELACTYDISPKGARLVGVHSVKREGEVVAVERGKNKALFRVAWIGEAGSELQGQVGIQCVEEDKTLWDSDLEKVAELYDPLPVDNKLVRVAPAAVGPERRRFPRFQCEGMAEMLRRSAQAEKLEAALANICEHGCLLTANFVLTPGSSVSLVLNIANCELRLKGQVRHSKIPVGVGIEFNEIRKGDRPLLRHLLERLRKLSSQAQPAPAGTLVRV